MSTSGRSLTNSQSVSVWTQKSARVSQKSARVSLRPQVGVSIVAQGPAMYKDFKSGGLMGPPTKNYTVLLQQLWLERGRHNADQSKWKHMD